mgnify:CR=1 FL=1
MTCGIIPPRRENIIGDRLDEYLGECIREKHNFGPHVLRTPEGKLFAWEDDMECDCCKPTEDDRCYTYWEINESEFEDICVNKRRS